MTYQYTFKRLHNHMHAEKSMNILLLGSGGREHALAWAITRSPLVNQLYVAPGNAGTAYIAQNVDLPMCDASKIIEFCQRNAIDFVMIGPETPLVAGMHDALTEAGILSIGPSKAAAQLEGSKAFTKRICDSYHIPTAAYGKFTDAAEAKAYITQQGVPIVIKADGLAAGKGVVIARTFEEAYQAVDDMLLHHHFGDASSSIVVETFLEGEEVSFFVLSDGKTAIAFGSAQDHKTAFDGDTGPNTGGMGTYSPAPVFTTKLQEQVMTDIIRPLLLGMEAEGMPYQGVLFAGLMLTRQGPILLEINVRFGDPETQVLMARLHSDLVPLLIATATGNLNRHRIQMDPHAAVCVVMATTGYPGDYVNGSTIYKLDQAAAADNTTIFHAGTVHGAHGEILANGGRVLGVTATGNTIKEAQKNAYSAVDAIEWPEGFCRRDIGWRAIA